MMPTQTTGRLLQLDRHTTAGPTAGSLSKTEQNAIFSSAAIKHSRTSTQIKLQPHANKRPHTLHTLPREKLYLAGRPRDTPHT